MLPISDPILIFATVLALILVVPMLARRVRLPEIVGLIAAGAIFGPHGLGILARDQTVHLLGVVGLLYIMFLAGLEIDLHQVQRDRSHAMVFGILTFLIPLILGIVLGRWAFGMTVSASLLLAGMLSSHTPITFPIVGKLGLAKSRSVVTERAGRRVALHESQAAFDASMAPHRILIPLQERQGAKELLDIALLLREKGSHEPVYPLQVAPEDRDADQKVAQAEKVLAHTVVRAMSAGVPVTPLTSVDLNVASGIIRAVCDNRISMILLAWDGQTTWKTRLFGRTIDAVVERSCQQVLVNRLRRPVSTAKRIVLVLPPFVDRQPGFESIVASVKTLASQAGTSERVARRHNRLAHTHARQKGRAGLAAEPGSPAGPSGAGLPSPSSFRPLSDGTAVRRPIRSRIPHMSSRPSSGTEPGSKWMSRPRRRRCESS